MLFFFQEPDLGLPHRLGHAGARPEGETHFNVTVVAAAFDLEIEIPKAYDIVQVSWTPPRAIPAGSPVVMHLHNHGYNNWRVVSLEAGPP